MIRINTHPAAPPRRPRLAQAPLALGILTLVCAPAINATAAPAPRCKQGQSSSRSTPCTTASAAARPRASSSSGTVVPHRDGDAVTIVRFVNPAAGGYQLEVENTSGIGYINRFTWTPPRSMTITQITGSHGGRCSLVPNPAASTDTQMIACSGAGTGIKPPTCLCSAGGGLLVNFNATTTNPPSYNDHYWTHYGIVGSYTTITSMTPVPYAIPSTPFGPDAQ
jgi:hypothetical protein